MVIMGASKFLLPIPKSTGIMSSSQNINVRTVAPTIINPESVLVDSIQRRISKRSNAEAAAEQARIRRRRGPDSCGPPSALRRSVRVEGEAARKAEEVWKVEEEEERSRKRRKTGWPEKRSWRNPGNNNSR